MTTSGNGSSVSDGLPINVHTSVDEFVLDLDYGAAPFEVAPHWSLAWRLGARLTDVYFDPSIQNVALSQQASNEFIGAGPHARLDVERSFDFVRGLAVFGRLDAAVMIGQIRQNYTESILQADGTYHTTTTSARHSQSVPNLLLQAGISYVPPILTNFKITTGYQFEQYWYVGQLGLIPPTNGMSGSHGELWSHGWFLRGQYDF
jgi:hypothetical protein